MDAIALIRLSVEIENEFGPDGDLRPLPSKDSALLSVHCHAGGVAVFFRHDIPSAMRQEILALGPGRMLRDHDAVRALLARHAACERVFMGKAYYFASAPPEEYLDAVEREGSWAVEVDGVRAAWAWTQDASDRACELAVETLPEYRRRGYHRRERSVRRTAVQTPEVSETSGV